MLLLLFICLSFWDMYIHAHISTQIFPRFLPSFLLSTHFLDIHLSHFAVFPFPISPHITLHLCMSCSSSAPTQSQSILHLHSHFHCSLSSLLISVPLSIVFHSLVIIPLLHSLWYSQDLANGMSIFHLSVHTKHTQTQKHIFTLATPTQDQHCLPGSEANRLTIGLVNRSTHKEMILVKHNVIYFFLFQSYLHLEQHSFSFSDLSVRFYISVFQSGMKCNFN